MPWLALMILAAMGFVLVAAETMPAGLLAVIAEGMGATEGTIGQFVSAWALGTVVVTIPAISLTRTFGRKPLILVLIVCLIAANTVTALSSVVLISLVSRFMAGAAAGAIWGMLAAYARQISPAARGGLALSIVSIGAPLGFALGTPLGAWLGALFGWRWSFAGLSALSLIALLLIAKCVPGAAGRTAADPGRLLLGRVFMMPGVAIVCLTIFVWMLAHNTIYTYIAPYLRATGTGLGADLVLLVYGVGSVVGLGITAIVIDRQPRALLHLSVALFIAAAIVLLLAASSPAAVLGAAAMWGIAFGGASAQLQSALTTAGRENADIANSFLPVAFNVAIFAAGIIGAGLIANFDALVLAGWMGALGVIVLAITVWGRGSAYRSGRAPHSDHGAPVDVGRDSSN